MKSQLGVQEAVGGGQEHLGGTGAVEVFEGLINLFLWLIRLFRRRYFSFKLLTLTNKIVFLNSLRRVSAQTALDELYIVNFGDVPF